MKLFFVNLKSFLLTLFLASLSDLFFSYYHLLVKELVCAGGFTIEGVPVTPVRNALIA
jgi:hypothetical protein